MTPHIICDVIMVLLKYGKYIEKPKLTAQAVHMQIMMIYMCKQNDGRTLLYNLKKFKSLPLLLWTTVKIKQIGISHSSVFFWSLYLKIAS